MKKITPKEIWHILEKCKDPELNVSIVDLGLVYEVKIDSKNNVYIKMTLTTPACPLRNLFLQQIYEKVKTLSQAKDVKIDLVFDPPWTPDRIKPHIKAQLGLK